jgi:hypothetical protein
MKIFKKLKIIKNKITGSSLKDQHKNHSLQHDRKMDFDIDLNINSKNLKELVFRISVAEKAFELNIKKLETDIKKCEDKIKEALIRDDEFEAKIWLQKNISWKTHWKNISKSFPNWKSLYLNLRKTSQGTGSLLKNKFFE